MQDDVRDKAHLDEDDVLSLNFIRDPSFYMYRRHYRAGLRSHIMEVLSPTAVEHEVKGVIIAGSTWYPRAEPTKMLRIFRTRFSSLQEALEEVDRVKVIEAYLAPDHLAKSDEFLVDYLRVGKRELLLCGLQEYVNGVVLNPWARLDENHLVSLFRRIDFRNLEGPEGGIDTWSTRVRQKAEGFVERLKALIVEAHYVPDLAGAGNLLLTRSGDIKLVDINNISEVSSDPNIHLDDRGYPVCDKSIEALSLLEQKLIGTSSREDDLMYKAYLDPHRMKKVKSLVEQFNRNVDAAQFHPEFSPS